jgi:hypothetical protein
MSSNAGVDRIKRKPDSMQAAGTGTSSRYLDVDPLHRVIALSNRSQLKFEPVSFALSGLPPGKEFSTPETAPPKTSKQRKYVRLETKIGFTTEESL